MEDAPVEDMNIQNSGMDENTHKSYGKELSSNVQCVLFDRLCYLNTRKYM